MIVMKNRGRGWYALKRLKKGGERDVEGIIKRG